MRMNTLFVASHDLGAGVLGTALWRVRRVVDVSCKARWLTGQWMSMCVLCLIITIYTHE